MGRLIDADALEREGWSLYRNYQQDKNVMVYETKSIQEIPTAQPYTEAEIQKMQDLEQAELKKAFELGKAEANRWIPCSERLPNGQTEVIVSCVDDSGDTKFRYTASGWVTTDGEYWIVDNEINNYVIAWMPLPCPYQPERRQ